MKIKKGKILLEFIYNLFLWQILYLTSIIALPEEYAKNLLLYYLPIAYQGGFVLNGILEQERKYGKKNTLLFWLNTFGLIFIGSRFSQAFLYLIIAKNEKMLYSLGIIELGIQLNRECLLYIALIVTMILSFANCIEE